MTPPPNRTTERNVPLLTADPAMHPEMNPVSDLPGIVIFLHGVNDPGGNYDVIEQGLCEGLNERLDAFRLVPGEYGKKYADAKNSKLKPGDEGYQEVARKKYDPDTYLYERSDVVGEVGTATHSVFIPFYWGYRASQAEIAKRPPEKGGDKDGYETVRGQYQDKYGNRLSKHFAKGGGMFNNATNSIPPMFGPGFHDSVLNKAASMAMSKYEFSGQSPHRRYMVLAAERLAMLVRDIRAVSENDTITIIGHSQGTLVTLLAQALLLDGRPERIVGDKVVPAIPPHRPADCLILVDSPYALVQPALEPVVQPGHETYSTRGKLNTLARLVEAVAAAKHPEPALTDLSAARTGDGRDGGRTGARWSPDGSALRRERDGKTYPFVERDNRGKVYMYFCPEDGTVQLPTIQGMGSEGIPDVIHEPHLQRVAERGIRHPSELPATDIGLPAMDRLKAAGFFQRAWTRMAHDRRGHSTAIGQETCQLEFQKGQRLTINGEAISPPYEPNMYGGEVVKGTPKKAGKITPNDYAQDLAVGNRKATFRKIPMGCFDSAESPADEQKARFNADKEPDDQTFLVMAEIIGISRTTGLGTWFVERELTPNEARARMSVNAADQQTNSYHSAALAHVDNIRRVTAMDVAIGQAKALDDPDWRSLFIAMADWKITAEIFEKIINNRRFNDLGSASRALIQGSLDYYQSGAFPSDLVSTLVPSTIDMETIADRIRSA